jgi:hypothetical protein
MDDTIDTIVWGADGNGTTGVVVVPMPGKGKADLAIGVARRHRPNNDPKKKPKVSIPLAAAMTLEDARKAYARLGQVIEDMSAERGESA